MYISMCTNSVSIRTSLLTRWQLSWTLGSSPNSQREVNSACVGLQNTHTLHPTTSTWSTFVLAYLNKPTAMMRIFFIPACFIHSSRREKGWALKHTIFLLSYLGLILGRSVAGFTGSCSRLIPYSKSERQRPQSWFLGARSKAVGV